MQKVLTAAEMREVDRLTTEHCGIPSILLMENAAHAVARVITEKLGGSVKGKSILILCGKGNNGGDGAAVARKLGQDGAFVDVLLFGKIKDTKGDARINFGVLCPENFDYDDVYFSNFAELREIESKEAWVQYCLNSKQDWDVIVDAVFGTGLSRPLDIWLGNVIHDINFIHEDPSLRHRLLVSIDVPSGLESDSASHLGEPFKAELTVTFTAPKPANVLPGAVCFNGELIVADIGSPAQLIDEQGSSLFLTERNDVEEWLEAAKFTARSYKNKRGHALLVVGSEDYSGAAVLAGNAAMRSGVGLVTLATPRSWKESVASRSLPEVIVRSITENDSGGVSETAFAESKEILQAADAIAVGCGLSATDKGVEKLVREIVETRTRPVIVDAGALWFFNRPAGIPPTREGQPPLIFTPHEGEFMRLLETNDKEAIKDRVAAVREFATKHDVILVLKGERVLIGEPGGKVVVNPTGNSGLGKAGNGDTLTGILAGFVAQAAAIKIDTFETVVAAIYIAGLAGDVAAEKFGKRVMTASDVRECFVEAFRRCEADAVPNS